MKNLVLATFLIVASVFAQAADLCQTQVSLRDGRPWPWGQEVQIPWRNLQGVWETSGGECENLFMFRVKTDQTGEKVVQILQYDPVTCQTIAQGLGYESGRYIYAQMVREGQSYNLTIHAFNGSVMEENIGGTRSTPASGRYVLALTLSPIGQWDNKSAFEIAKVSNITNKVCHGL